MRENSSKSSDFRSLNKRRFVIIFVWTVKQLEISVSSADCCAWKSCFGTHTVLQIDWFWFSFHFADWTTADTRWASLMVFPLSGFHFWEPEFSFMTTAEDLCVCVCVCVGVWVGVWSSFAGALSLNESLLFSCSVSAWVCANFGSSSWTRGFNERPVHTDSLLWEVGEEKRWWGAQTTIHTRPYVSIEFFEPWRMRNRLNDLPRPCTCKELLRYVVFMQVLMGNIR